MGLLENPSLLPFRPVPVPSPRSERASLASTARVQFLTTAVRSAVLFVFQWLLARAYGANAFGVCNTAQAGMQTATMLGRAAGDTVVLRAHDEDHLASGTTLSLLGGVAAAVTLAAWGLYFARGQQDVAPLIAFGLAAAAVPPATLLFPLGAGLQRQNRFRAYALVVTLLDPVVRLATLGAAVMLGGPWWWGMSAFIIGAVASLVTTIVLLRDSLRALPARIAAPGEHLKVITFSSLTTVAAALQNAMIFGALTVAASVGTPRDAGVLAAAIRIVTLALWIQAAYATPFLPRIPRLVERPDHHDDLQAMYTSVVRSVLWFNGPFLVGLVLAAPAILALFGAEFVRGAVLISVLAVGQWVNSATALAEDFLPLSGRSHLALANNLAALALTAVGGTVLGRHYGVLGIAWAYAGAVVLLNAVRALQIWRLFRVSIPLTTVGRSALACGGTVLLAALLPIRVDLSIAERLIAGIAGAVVALLAMYGIASHSERRALMALVRGVD